MNTYHEWVYWSAQLMIVEVIASITFSSTSYTL